MEASGTFSSPPLGRSPPGKACPSADFTTRRIASPRFSNRPAAWNGTRSAREGDWRREGRDLREPELFQAIWPSRGKKSLKRILLGPGQRGKNAGFGLRAGPSKAGARALLPLVPLLPSRAHCPCILSGLEGGSVATARAESGASARRHSSAPACPGYREELAPWPIPDLANGGPHLFCPLGERRANRIGKRVRPLDLLGSLNESLLEFPLESLIEKPRKRRWPRRILSLYK